MLYCTVPRLAPYAPHEPSLGRYEPLCRNSGGTTYRPCARTCSTLRHRQVEGGREKPGRSARRAASRILYLCLRTLSDSWYMASLATPPLFSRKESGGSVLARGVRSMGCVVVSLSGHSIYHRKPPSVGEGMRCRTRDGVDVLHGHAFVYLPMLYIFNHNLDADRPSGSTLHTIIQSPTFQLSVCRVRDSRKLKPIPDLPLVAPTVKGAVRCFFAEPGRGPGQSKATQSKAAQYWKERIQLLKRANGNSSQGGSTNLA